uniref:Uncharacterized protein n=1 Tax=Timema genevievae TaxID=629358 RepID=A0A7R9PGU5_TIMGE|nr:unnamed protein product [Timema genevievae]
MSDISGIKEYEMRNGKPAIFTDCTRECKAGAPRRICYYRFVLELYQVKMVWDIDQSNTYVRQKEGGKNSTVCKNDKIVVDLISNAHGFQECIHWHGLLQEGSQYYDGVPMLTQCAVQFPDTFRYQFNGSGGHETSTSINISGFNKPDGVHGSLVIRCPKSEEVNSHLYDYDHPNHTLSVTGWTHRPTTMDHHPGVVDRNSGVPSNLLINGKGQYTYYPVYFGYMLRGKILTDFLNPHAAEARERDNSLANIKESSPDGNTTRTPLAKFMVKRGKRYRFRLINSSSFICQIQIFIEDHNMTIIGTDGEPCEPRTVKSVITSPGMVGKGEINVDKGGEGEEKLCPDNYKPRQLHPKGQAAQRFDIVIYAIGTRKSYWIQAKALGPCDGSNIGQVAILKYNNNDEESIPETPRPTPNNSLPEGVDLLSSRLIEMCVYHSFVVRIGHYRTGQPPAPIGRDIDGYGLEFDGMNTIMIEADYVWLRVDTMNAGVGDREEGRGVGKGMKAASCNALGKHDPQLGMINNISDFDLEGPIISQYIDEDIICNKTHLSPTCRKSEICVCKHIETLPLNKVVELVFYSPDRYWLIHCHFDMHMIAGMKFVLHVGTKEDLPPVPKESKDMQDTFLQSFNKTRKPTRRRVKKEDPTQSYETGDDEKEGRDSEEVRSNNTAGLKHKSKNHLSTYNMKIDGRIQEVRKNTFMIVHGITASRDKYSDMGKVKNTRDEDYTASTPEFGPSIFAIGLSQTASLKDVPGRGHP